MKRSRGKPINQEMNLTNMIDVVFAILIVFLISAPLMSQGIKVELPKAEAPTMEQEKLLNLEASIKTSSVKLFKALVPLVSQRSFKSTKRSIFSNLR